MEEAQGYQRLIDEFSYDHEKVSKFIEKVEAIQQQLENSNTTQKHT